MLSDLTPLLQEFMYFSLCAQTAIVLLLVVIWIHLRKQNKQK